MVFHDTDCGNDPGAINHASAIKSADGESVIIDTQDCDQLQHKVQSTSDGITAKLCLLQDNYLIHKFVEKKLEEIQFSGMYLFINI